MQIDKEIIGSFRKDFAACVADLEKKYGVTLRVGTIHFSPGQFHGKLTVKSTDSEALSLEATQKNRWLKSQCLAWGVATNSDGLIGSTYFYQGKRYLVTDYESSRRKNKIVVKCLTDNAPYVVPWAYLKLMKLEA